MTALSPLVGILVGGGFTLFGVGLKIAYDAVLARRHERREAIVQFAPERRAAYEKFLQLSRAQRDYEHRLHKLVEAHHRGDDVPQEVMDAFPPSPMKDFVAALDEVRRVARTYAVISVAEALLRLVMDMTAAMRQAMESPSEHDEIVWFVLQRLHEDREREFIYHYRADLGLRPPEGGPKRYPLSENPWASGDLPESILRSALKAMKEQTPPPGSGTTPAPS